MTLNLTMNLGDITHYINTRICWYLSTFFRKFCDILITSWWPCCLAKIASLNLWSFPILCLGWDLILTAKKASLIAYLKHRWIFYSLQINPHKKFYAHFSPFPVFFLKKISIVKESKNRKYSLVCRKTK